MANRKPTDVLAGRMVCSAVWNKVLTSLWSATKTMSLKPELARTWHSINQEIFDDCIWCFEGSFLFFYFDILVLIWKVIKFVMFMCFIVICAPVLIFTLKILKLLEWLPLKWMSWYSFWTANQTVSFRLKRRLLSFVPLYEDDFESFGLEVRYVQSRLMNPFLYCACSVRSSGLSFDLCVFDGTSAPRNKPPNARFND